GADVSKACVQEAVADLCECEDAHRHLRPAYPTSPEDVPGRRGPAGDGIEGTAVQHHIGAHLVCMATRWIEEAQQPVTVLELEQELATAPQRRMVATEDVAVGRF